MAIKKSLDIQINQVSLQEAIDKFLTLNHMEKDKFLEVLCEKYGKDLVTYLYLYISGDHTK